MAKSGRRYCFTETYRKLLLTRKSIIIILNSKKSSARRTRCPRAPRKSKAEKQWEDGEKEERKTGSERMAVTKRISGKNFAVKDEDCGVVKFVN